MARLSYECDNSTKSGDDEDAVSKPFPCAPDKYCFYCCCNPQCCYVIQRRPLKHFWEAWYFWLGIALLVIIVLSTVGTYVVTNCKQNLQAIGYGGNGPSGNNNGQNSNRISESDNNNEQQPNRNEISINIIPTSAVLSTHRKIMLIAPQPSCTHLMLFVTVFVIAAILLCGVDDAAGRKCVCTSKACRESGAKTCRTRFSCYTELIVSGEPTGVKTTRGCTEGATPLLCETKSWRSNDDPDDSSNNSLDTLLKLGRAAAWPRLTCCDSHDYCNAADEDFESTSNTNRPSGDANPSNKSNAENKATDELQSEEQDYRNHVYNRGPLRTPISGGAQGSDGIQSLHIAALVLAIAALISVFAACYVVTSVVFAALCIVEIEWGEQDLN
ncbi:hypothetical protein TSAR_006579 [Trichomalopsis sarcophagae]|uniref:Activin types I and II receptor domain-containing protein n=1 Tax=Trichomalopsis sarcophagae TaxID=543379 RepID=A0A232FCI5_9HYME|nr:hypothetical protein TSAR_006579 [Trichomalopsis sarcophagae]